MIKFFSYPKSKVLPARMSTKCDGGLARMSTKYDGGLAQDQALRKHLVDAFSEGARWRARLPQYENYWGGQAEKKERILTAVPLATRTLPNLLTGRP